MQETSFQIPVLIYRNSDELDPADAELLEAARNATLNAYAPYSKFNVGAAARLDRGQILTGSNQENASYPAGICAERVLLSSVSAVFPNVPVVAVAISYRNEKGKSDHPISPCGICRQTLAEYEQRFKRPIRLILAGDSGEVFVIQRATDLLPFAFSSEELKRK